MGLRPGGWPPIDLAALQLDMCAVVVVTGWRRRRGGLLVRLRRWLLGQRLLVRRVLLWWEGRRMLLLVQLVMVLEGCPRGRRVGRPRPHVRLNDLVFPLAVLGRGFGTFDLHLEAVFVLRRLLELTSGLLLLLLLLGAAEGGRGGGDGGGDVGVVVVVMMVVVMVVLGWRGGGAHPPTVRLGDVGVEVNDQVAHAHVPLLVVILKVGRLLPRLAGRSTLLLLLQPLLLLLLTRLTSLLLG